MITADTVTDEQIRELRDGAAGFRERDIVHACDVALTAGHARRDIARARCANLINMKPAIETARRLRRRVVTAIGTSPCPLCGKSIIVGELIAVARGTRTVHVTCLAQSVRS